MRNRLLSILALVALATATGCGTKGPLFLPPADTTQSAEPDNGQ